MTAAERRDNSPVDPPALTAALGWLSAGLWPVVITHPDDPNPRLRAPGKQPIGDDWALGSPTPAALRAKFAGYPAAGVGLRLGPLGGVVDVDVDQPEHAGDVLARMFPAGLPPTRGWSNAGGKYHLLFRWDDRLGRYGRAIIKGVVTPDGAVRGNPAYAGLEIRLGYNPALEGGGQYQTVIPPSPTADGSPRAWNGHAAILELPEDFYIDLDRHVLPPVGRGEDPRPGPKILPFSPEPVRVPVDLATRVRGYLATVEPAVSGSGGHDKTIGAACRVGPGFDLEPAVALAFLAEWNRSCQPPWSDKELRHKVEDAYKREPRRGWLRDATPSRPEGSPHDRGMDTMGRSPGRTSGGPGKLVHPAPGLPVLELEWERPRLKEEIEPVSFPLDVFPHSLQGLCRQAAASIQCPVDYLGAFALAFAGAAIGNSVNLRVTRTWKVAPNLFLAVVGPPGTRKSPALFAMAEPLFGIDARERRAYDERKAAHLEAVRELEAAKRARAVDLPEVPPKPVRVQLTMDDITKERVAQLHAENPRGPILIKDELTAWVAGLNAYRAGRGDDKQFWMKANTGALIKVDRKGSEEQSVIAHPCLSVAGCLTPDTLGDMHEGGGRRRDDGWMDRLLFAYPEPILPAGWVEDEVDEVRLEDWTIAIDRLWAARPANDDFGNETPHLIRLTPEAKARYVGFFDEHCAEKRADDFPPHLLGPWSKLEGYTLRFALILSRLAHAYGLDEAMRPCDVVRADVEGAIRLADYFKVHYRRARARLVGRVTDAGAEADAILRWIVRHGHHSFEFRDVSRHFPRFDETSRRAALDDLARRDAIRERPRSPRVPGQPGALKKPIFDVNPHLHAAAGGGFPDDWT